MNNYHVKIETLVCMALAVGTESMIGFLLDALFSTGLVA